MFSLEEIHLWVKNVVPMELLLPDGDYLSYHHSPGSKAPKVRPSLAGGASAWMQKFNGPTRTPKGGQLHIHLSFPQIINFIFQICNNPKWLPSLGQKTTENLTDNIRDIHSDLVALCRENDRTAQIRIYELYYQAMYNTSYRIVNDPMEAEDIMQDAFLDAFRKIDSFKGDSTFGTWLKRIVINKSLDHLRKQKDYTASFEEENFEIPDSSAEDQVEQEIVRHKVSEIVQAMERLPDSYRIILSLYLLEGYDHQEISEILNISYNNTRTRYTRAKQKLLQEVSGPKHHIPDFHNN
jgi:RNA polymerase sigma-70 factor (ECF subfamily)